ncbi:hypothetical protein M0G43_08490 [Subsaxibacter sp. CAU 1640]|uniref:hypothetical protein n=1 Tax=Subsaxibacter sp. CAU 1640 TaxID=2933271 RepID=UPI00200547C3|nr:hypothetical protein [Subsaxibacter sp. CAU 1640]MCK7590608.1 hypothetical protein [Subsaxibacter sp. CAU 1640]
MEIDDYNRVARLFQFLNNNHSQLHYQYGGFEGSYKTYQVDDVQLPDDTLQLIDELKFIKVADFYKKDYLIANGYPERYINNEMVKTSDTLFGFHYQVPTILFYYIFNGLKEAAIQFLKEIDSDNFKSLYGHMVSRDKYNFEYPSIMHDEIFKYFDSRIPNFNLLHHQLNWLSDMSYSDGSMTTYKILRLENCIENLKGFDFGNIDLIN